VSALLAGLPYIVWAPPLLVFARTISLFAASPLTGASVLPMTVRVLIGLVIAFFALTAGVPVSLPPESYFPLALISEVGVGLVIGFLATLVFSLFHTAGATLDSELGFTVAQVFNPLGPAGQETLLANWFDSLGTVIFLLLGGVQVLVASAVESFQVVPMNVVTLTIGKGFLPALTAAFVGSFLIAMEIAAPILLALLLIDLIGAALGRLLPQLNVLTFNIPVKMWTGLGLVAIFMPALVDAGRLAIGVYGQSVSEIVRNL